MSYAIKRYNGDILWFDAVLSANTELEGKVTSHPIASGSFITDTFITENMEVTLSAVISDADFNTTRPVMEGAQGNILNNLPSHDTLTISGVASPNILNVLPSAIGNAINSPIPNISVSDKYAAIQFTQEKAKDLLFQINRGGEPVSLMVFDYQGRVTRLYKNCLVKRLSFPEHPQDGEALYCDLTLEQVTVVTLQSAATPKFKPIPSSADAAAGVSKGTNTDGEFSDSSTNTAKDTDSWAFQAFEEGDTNTQLQQQNATYDSAVNGFSPVGGLNGAKYPLSTSAVWSGQ